MSPATPPFVFAPGAPEYERATLPRNTSATQRPRQVAVPGDTDQLAAAVSYAGANGLSVVPQATGHGAGGVVDDDCLLVDTSALSWVRIDGSGVGTAGAGTVWGTVEQKADERGLLGLAGSAPSVGIAGFTFGGGAGWLTRPYGLAAGSLLTVDYVDGAGRVRRAADDAPDPVDREALFAFRGGGEVGMAAALTFQLFPAQDLHAGLLLWPIEHLEAVVAAWAKALPQVGPALTTSLGVLTAPPSPLVPAWLQGARVVHLAVACSTGSNDAQPLWAALGRAPAETTSTWGPADAERLGGIHLDPPVAVPGVGIARWLDAAAPTVAADVLRAAADSPLEMAELRNVDNTARVRDGALTRPPGAFILHAVGGTDDPAARDAALDQVGQRAAPADTGLSTASWVDGAAAVPDALPEDVRSRVAAARAAVDPDGVVARSRFLG